MAKRPTRRLEDEIASRPELVKRLRAAAEDAKKRRGRFVRTVAGHRKEAYR